MILAAFRSRALPLVGAMVMVPEAAAAQATVPLCRGLSIVAAVNEPFGDYEPIVTLESADREGLDFRFSAQVNTGRSIRHLTARRRVLIKDLETARLSNPWMSSDAPRVLPGTTIGPSRAVYRSLKSTGKAQIGLVDRGNATLSSNRDVHPNLFDVEMLFDIRRVGTGTVSFPVIVNGTKVSLPTIRATGEHMGDKAEWYILDDPANPMSLQFTLTPLGGGQAATGRVIKISHSCAAKSRSPAASALEQSLLETGRAEVYHIYFDFNSDRIRSESDPTLEEIAAILRRHPTWKLTVEGHTDSIGGAAPNLELSRRRAAAVKTALVERHRIDTGRLATSGAGASRPKDTNSTLEGRARNRRVELVRQ